MKDVGEADCNVIVSQSRQQARSLLAEALFSCFETWAESGP